ncbi:MAG: integration host factor subunit beta [Bacteroidales bacterium]|nr:integration host factor subunit beta [Bacteroidales bacterium]MDE7465350.1 integration host factor subunit beta [Muribaculaceae bacterium]
MTKADINNIIAESTGVNPGVVMTVVEHLMAVIKDSVAHGDNVYLRGFGSFIVKERKEKPARNISKNTSIIVEAHNIPAFKPAPAFKKAVAEGIVGLPLED